MHAIAIIIAIELIIGSLMGAAIRLKVHVGTWNVDGKGPKGDIDKLVGLKFPPSNDLILLGIQELVSSSPLGAIAKAITGEKWSKTLEEMFKTKGYTKVETRTLFGLGNYVYILNKHIKSLNASSVKVEEVKTGLFNKIGNKGGIIISFDLYGKGFTAISSHLPAHFEHNDKRVTAYHQILNKTIEQGLKDDFMFWYGDLNFRLDFYDLPSRRRIRTGRHLELLAHDQLKLCQKNKTAFDGWSEGPINFKPTYKYEPLTNEYSTKRIPAWTDRVLYKTQAGNSIELRNYKRLEYNRTDHRPVIANFLINVK